MRSTVSSGSERKGRTRDLNERLAYSRTCLLDILTATDLLRSITDPEHPLTLEQLAVVSSSQITLSKNHVLVEFTPTIPHCSMATLIGQLSLPFWTLYSLSCSLSAAEVMTELLFHYLKGLSLRVRLLRSLPERYKVDIRVKEGTHQSEHAGELPKISVLLLSVRELTCSVVSVRFQSISS
jgi:hypothetical protein